MQQGKVDIVITGADRLTNCGDVCNKIGTYLKAISAKENKIPFYAAVPTSTIDWNIDDYTLIPIELRSDKELSHINTFVNNKVVKSRIYKKDSLVYNPTFDITPAKYVDGIITELGIYDANKDSLLKLKKKVFKGF